MDNVMMTLAPVKRSVVKIKIPGSFLSNHKRAGCLQRLESGAMERLIGPNPGIQEPEE
jgi:hypothetical protein